MAVSRLAPRRSVVEVSGGQVTLTEISLGGFLSVLEAVDACGLRVPVWPMPLDVLVAALGDEARAREQQRAQWAETSNELFGMLCRSRRVVEVMLAAVTDLSPEEISACPPALALRLLSEALKLTEWEALYEAAAGFFSDIGDRTRRWAQLRAQSAGTTGSASGPTGSSAS